MGGGGDLWRRVVRAFVPITRAGGGRKTFKVCNMYTESVIRGAVPLAKPSANRKRGCSGDRERAEGGTKMKV